MKIALMTNNYKPFVGGVPISVERLADSLRKAGHSVTVFAPSYKEQQDEEGVFRYGTLCNHFMGGIVLPNPFDIRIDKCFKQEHFDIIHVHHPMMIGRTAVYLSHKYNIPLVFTYHTRYEEYLSYIKPVRWMEGIEGSNRRMMGPLAGKALYFIKECAVPLYLKAFLKHCGHVFAPTEGMLEYLENTCGMEKGLLTILPTGLPESCYMKKEDVNESIREKYNLGDNLLLLSVSRMSHEKNVEFLIESLVLFKQKLTERGKSFTMLFVGDGPEKANYEERCKSLGLDEVHFVGAVPNQNIYEYYAEADAFLFASKTETQGIVLLESFAQGTPVYAVKASGVNDLVRDGINGRLFDEDTEDFAEGLTELLDSDTRIKLGAGAAVCAEAYTEETVAERAVSVYTYTEKNFVRKGAYHGKVLYSGSGR